VDASICACESYIFDGDTLTTAGSYPFVFIGANGCDSTVTIILDVLPLQTSSVQATTCNGTGYVFNGDTLTLAGVYTAILTGVNGCDSTVTLTLTVLPTQATTISASTCANEPYNFNGQILTTSGNYDFIYGGANGCDSTVTVQLTVLPISETIIAASICAGEIYEYDGDTLTTTGTYTFVYDAVNSCDSIVTVELTVRPLLSSSLSVSLCNGGSYIFNNDTLTTAGTYVVTTPGSNGCDSTATVILSFVPGFETALQATICNGESYNFGGQTLTTSGTYTNKLTADGGCDSPVTGTSINASICPGETYILDGDTLSTSGNYTAILTASNGCDSTVMLNLVVRSVPTTNVSATICATETYVFNGDTLSTSGTYTDTLTGSNGCDSIAVLKLTVLSAQSSSLEVSICEGETYIYENDTLTTSGTFPFVLNDVNGCDSTVTLQLTVLPRAQSAFASIVCNGEPFVYNGDTLTSSGTYLFNFSGASVNGCDSVVTVFLTIFPAIPPTSISASICPGATYDFYGTPLTAAGTYSFDLASANGCDSTIILALSINVVNTLVNLQSGTLTAQATNATYQWINCNGNTPIPGANSSSYTPTVTGEYAVIVTQGACTGTSTCQLVQVVSAYEPLEGSNWAVQPNPARSEATIVLQEVFSEQAWIEVYDASGRLLQRQILAAGANRADLDLNGFSDGMLLVRLVTEQGTSTKRLMKTKN
jgi:Tfp pilus assembly major pilin PilA